jgi:hypothetical protein
LADAAFQRKEAGEKTIGVKVTSMAGLPDYAEDWRRYKTARNILWLIFFSYLPGAFAVAWGLSKILSRDASEFFVPVGLIWMVALVVGTLRVYLWHCPRCEKSFSGTFRHNKGFLARKCVNCGLPKYAIRPQTPSDRSV